MWWCETFVVSSWQTTKNRYMGVWDGGCLTHSCIGVHADCSSEECCYSAADNTAACSTRNHHPFWWMEGVYPSSEHPKCSSSSDCQSLGRIHQPCNWGSYRKYWILLESSQNKAQADVRMPRVRVIILFRWIYVAGTLRYQQAGFQQHSCPGIRPVSFAINTHMTYHHIYIHYLPSIICHKHSHHLSSHIYSLWVALCNRNPISLLGNCNCY